MKKSAGISILISLACLANIGCHSRRQESSSADQQLYSNHKPYTRWWWFATEIDTNDVRDQLVWLKDHEFGGVEIAWIYPMGLDTTTVKPAFMSEEWSKAVVYAKHIADSLGLGCDFTYGTLWPFSDVNMPDGDQSRNYFDSVNVAKRALTWDHPLVGRILNHLDKEAFFRYADRMNKHLSKAYAGTKSGLFVDSWEVETDYLWTNGFKKTFMAEHGYDITPYMEGQSLTDKQNIDVKYDYMSTLSGYVMREFYQPFAENAKQQGAFSRAQCGGAPTDLLTAFTLVDIPETEAILYEPSFSKIAASAATLGNKDAVTAETFTCAYGWTSLRYKNGRGQSPHQGEEQIADLKLICDALFANGTNQIIWHGFPYNKVGRTDNYFYTTCQVSTNPNDNLSGEALTAFNRYMTRVSDYMRKGHNYSSLAVYIPLEDSWMSEPYPEEVLKMMPWIGGPYELRYIQTPSAYKGMQPLWVNGHFLAKAEFKNGTLHCGNADFKALYIDAEYIDMKALKKIVRLAKQGLPVCLSRTPKEPGVNKHNDYTDLLNELEALKIGEEGLDKICKPLIEGEELPDLWCRQDGNTYYVFIANPLAQTVTYPMTYGYAFSDQGAVRDITVNHHGKSEKISLKFRPTESLLLQIDEKGIQIIDLEFSPAKMKGLE
ncbi:MAG: hypothetical protein IJ196_00210 [Prevotella sp.]|nr:hypothetical protein [Prevotella sp.]